MTLIEQSDLKCIMIYFIILYNSFILIRKDHILKIIHIPLFWSQTQIWQTIKFNIAYLLSFLNAPNSQYADFCNACLTSELVGVESCWYGRIIVPEKGSLSIVREHAEYF